MAIQQVIGKILCVWITCCLPAAGYQTESGSMSTALELQDGDRVVLLGSALIERDQAYGFIEAALASRWPDRHITFRNLGWSGDTVFGEARDYFTTPPDAYGHLIDQIKNAEPTVVFIAYGGIEAFEGTAGIPMFARGVNQLLDEVEALGAKAILISPTPHFPAYSPVPDPVLHNINLRLYTTAISEVASKRGLTFIDLFTPLLSLSEEVELTTNGVHLNERGYYYAAVLLEEGLGWKPREWKITLDTHAPDAEGVGNEVSDLTADINSVEFAVRDHVLPLSGRFSRGHGMRILKVSGLGEGTYSLSIDEMHIIAATAEEWSAGVELAEGPPFVQSDSLRSEILAKNELYFHSFRPQNRTYLLGFRSYEQGQNAKELEELLTLVEQREGDIARLRQPRTHVYRLLPAEQAERTWE